MRLTDKQLSTYRQIYRDTYSEDVPKDVALVQGIALLRLMEALTSVAKENEKENDYGTRTKSKTLS